MHKIYTKTGDKGTTGLANGKRVPKNSERIEAYGTVDELNCIIGICIQSLQGLSETTHLEIKKWLFAIQNDLFNLGSDLATPIESRWENMIVISSVEITQLEKMIDICQEKLSPLREFVLPGGTFENSYLHLARAVCRRAERNIVTLSQIDEINLDAIKYINRLSDLFFILARYVQQEKKVKEMTWQKNEGTSFINF